VPPGEIPNPLLDARVKDKAVENVVFQTTADKILGLLKDEPIPVTLKEGVVIEFYPPSDEQYIDLLCIRGDGIQYTNELKKSGISENITDSEAEDKYPELMGMVNGARDMLSKINQMLSDLAVDKSWTSDKFKQMSMVYKQTIIKAISEDHKADVEAARKFREKRKRNRARTNA
jgi:hypothetical protein